MIGASAKSSAPKPKPMNMEFKGLIPALLGGRLDLINSAMYINEQARGAGRFRPLHEDRKLIVVKAGNPSKITGRDNSLCGKTISVTLGGNRGDLCAAGRQALQGRWQGAGVTVQTLPDRHPTALTSVVQGRADAMFTSTPGAAE